MLSEGNNPLQSGVKHPSVIYITYHYRLGLQRTRSQSQMTLRHEGYILERLPVYLRVGIYISWQFKVAMWCNLHVFGLWRKPNSTGRTCKLHAETPSQSAGTTLLWGNSMKHCTIMAPLLQSPKWIIFQLQHKCWHRFTYHLTLLNFRFNFC